MKYVLLAPCHSYHSTASIFSRRKSAHPYRHPTNIIRVQSVCTCWHLLKWTTEGECRASIFLYVDFFFCILWEMLFSFHTVTHHHLTRFKCVMIPDNHDFDNNPRYYTVHVLVDSKRHTQLLYSLGSDSPKLISSVVLLKPF